MATLTFDIPNQVIEVDLPDLNLTIQELWDQTQTFLGTHQAMSIPHFMFGAGKDDLGGGNFVGITVTLVDWCVKFADRAGPTTIVTTISGGNLVGRVGTIAGAVQHPVCSSLFTFNTINQSTSPALIAAPIPDESHLTVAYVESTSIVRMGVWLEREGVVVTSPIDATVVWYNPGGSVLFTVNDVGPDAQGHFQIDVTQALADDTAYYAIVTVTDASGLVTTRRGVATAGT
tara:strand:- start:43948 stop:44640 length:693 start_codon:yes stop_codon:yes gene_type:complete